jgi:hypothetical protein
MSSVYNRNTGCAIRVYVPGPPGPPLVNVGTILSPVAVDGGTIAAPVNRFQRSFITAALGPLVQPVIPNPGDNGPWLWCIYNVGSNPITLNNAANIKLSGEIVMNPDTVLWLQWDGNSRYIEDHRNEI